MSSFPNSSGDHFFLLEDFRMALQIRFPISPENDQGSSSSAHAYHVLSHDFVPHSAKTCVLYGFNDIERMSPTGRSRCISDGGRIGRRLGLPDGVLGGRDMRWWGVGGGDELYCMAGDEII